MDMFALTCVQARVVSLEDDLAKLRHPNKYDFKLAHDEEDESTVIGRAADFFFILFN